MFAGPNGSGKSTLKSVLRPELIGIYLNPDDIEQKLSLHGFLDLHLYGVTTTAEKLAAFFSKSSFLASVGLAEVAGQIGLDKGRLTLASQKVNSYLASAAADFIRTQLLQQKTSFTLETVMSHESKVDLLKQAQQAGFRTYLYFVATEDPAINISRVRNRVRLGGHDVPDDKIETRYHRSLDLLMDAIRHTNRAYIFDNSGNNHDRTWIAEITDGSEIEMKANQIPAWFKRAVIDKARGKP